jgi:Protein of unknown function (DUF2630)
MDDQQIMAQIKQLIDTEHELRARVAGGELSSTEERSQLRSTEEALDQCWDLLRQRRARREFGSDPDAAHARPASEVEGYLE